MVIRVSHEHSIAAGVTGPRESILVPRIQSCLSDPTVPFELSRRRFPIKIAFAMAISKVHGRRLNVLEYIYLLPMASSMCIFSILFI
jgi:hypothetical protein